MKLSLNWLKDYVDPKLSTEALSQKLVMAGWEVEATHTVGQDTVFDLEITPNRPDCLNMLGLAREIGAITSRKVSYPKIKSVSSTGKKKSGAPAIVSIQDKKDCACYIATLLKDAEVKGSAPDLSQKLVSIGIRPISNAVDITNFVMMETGQPLHVFDYDKLQGGRIIVRRAKKGESLVTIDGVKRELDETILVIADAQRPVAIAGIMGGKDTEVTHWTKNILLESAHFDMGLIRRACRKLGLRSESSYRFERNVHLAGVRAGADRATGLLLSLAQARIEARQQAGDALEAQRKAIELKCSHVTELLGTELTQAMIKKHLSALGFMLKNKAGGFSVLPPDFRSDIKQEVDLIEEIARMRGFDQLASHLPSIKAVNIPVDPRPRALKKKIRQIMAGQGVDEIVTYSMTNLKALRKSGLGHLAAIKVFNALSQEQEIMRPALLPSMLQAALTNFNRGSKDLRFYEMGKRYLPQAERNTLGIILSGRRNEDWRLPKKENVDLLDLKGIVQQMFMQLGLPVEFKASPGPSFDSACAGIIRLKGKDIGALGKIDASILSQWDIKLKDVYFAEIDLEPLAQAPFSTRQYQPMAEYPAITRDVSIAIGKDISYETIEKICRQHGTEILKDVIFIEQYLGDKIQEGSKGIVFSCIYQSSTRTLKEEEVNAIHQGIIQELTRQLGASQR